MATMVIDDELISEADRPGILHDALSSKHLELIIFPTEKCNFRCDYCYEDFSIGRMPSPVRQGIKNLIDVRGPDLDVLQLSWFGGEPLQAYDVICDIAGSINILSAKHNFTRSMHITTNAFSLTQEKLVTLSSLGVTSYQITLDGTESQHNNTRKHINGSGTFQRIWDNLTVANRLYLSGTLPETVISLRLHIHPGNIEDMNLLARKITEELSPGLFRISVFPILKMGGPNDKVMEVFSRADAERLIDGFSESFSGFHFVKPGAELMCYAARANSFAIRADGRIAKCTVALQNDANTVGRISEDGRLNLDKNRLAPWLRPLSSMKKRDLACPVSQVLASGS